MALAFSLLDELNLLYTYYHFDSVQLEINSPGGDAIAMRHIIENLKTNNHIVKTLAIGEVSSAAAFLLTFGTPGERRALKGARLLYHFSRRVYASGTAHTLAQMRVEVKTLHQVDRELVDMVVARVSGDRKRLTRLLRADRPITPEKAMELGLIDEVLG